MKTPHLIALTLGGGIALGAVSSRILQRPPTPPPLAATVEAASEHSAPARFTQGERARSSRPASPTAAPYAAAPVTQSSFSSKAAAFPSAAVTTAPARASTANTDKPKTSRNTVQSPPSSAVISGGISVSQNYSGPAGVAASSSGGVPASSSGGSASSGNSAPPIETSEPEQAAAQSENPPVDLPVPVGTIAPAAYYDAEVRSPQQQAALDRIATEFEENVSNAGTGLSQEENWQAARKLADDRYLTLFGYQAYNQYHLQAAKEAVKEMKTSSAPVSAAPSGDETNP